MTDEQNESNQTKSNPGVGDFLGMLGGANPMMAFGRALEGAIFIWAVVATDLNRPAAFLLLFAILFGHYDNMYRALQGEHKPKWLAIAGGFILGRVTLLGIFLALGWSIVPLVWYFSVLFFVISSIQWVAGHKARSK